MRDRGDTYSNEKQEEAARLTASGVFGKNFMALSSYTFPDKPFMIALGTSHTAGDCDGPTYSSTSVKITAHDMIANELGLELVKIGLSGCKNQDLLQATNELAHHKVLNDNCKLFMLEPRLGDRTVRLPVETVVPDTLYVNQHKLPTDENNKLKDPLYPVTKNNVFTGYGMIEGWGRAVNLTPPTIQQVAVNGRPDVMNKWIIDKYGPISLSAQACIDASTFYSHSPLDIFNSVTIIDSIRHIVEANNVKFKWQIINGSDLRNKTFGEPELLPDLAKKLLGTHSTLFDSFINVMEDELRYVDMDTIKCGCGHYNKQGHRMWYNKTIDHLR